MMAIAVADVCGSAIATRSATATTPSSGRDDSPSPCAGRRPRIQQSSSSRRRVLAAFETPSALRSRDFQAVLLGNEFGGPFGVEIGRVDCSTETPSGRQRSTRPSCPAAPAGRIVGSKNIVDLTARHHARSHSAPQYYEQREEIELFTLLTSTDPRPSRLAVASSQRPSSDPVQRLTACITYRSRHSISANVSQCPSRESR